MAKRSKRSTSDPAAIQLPHNVLDRINLGASFAEHDRILERDDVFVRTPALTAAQDASLRLHFFVGRRGTGKTAISRYIAARNGRAERLVPAVFSPASTHLQDEDFSLQHQRPFKSLIAAFRRALQDEFIGRLLRDRPSLQDDLPQSIQEELDKILDWDFDTRVIRFIRDLAHAIASNDEETWLRLIKKPKTISQALSSSPDGSASQYTLMIDSIDDYWDGSDRAVSYLSALMHAILETGTAIPWTHPLLFLRENVFERVRAIDSEFARLETSVVGLDWTKPQLRELIERRLNAPLHTKLPLGYVWERFFEVPEKSAEMVFDYCQGRPRDVITYCKYAIVAAQSNRNRIVKVEDLQHARRRFSDNRLKDLGDEYAENFPRIDVVLSKFYGLGRRFTLAGIDGLLQRILVDGQVQSLCGEWIYYHSTPETFVRLLHNIAFVGIEKGGEIYYRSVGPRDTTSPPVTATTDIQVHPSYWDALDLRDLVVTSISDDTILGRAGVVADLPESLGLEDYVEQLQIVEDDLKTIPTGASHATQFEDLVGRVLELCHFRSLGNITPRSRTSDGRVIRDWVASVRASSGFWEVIRNRHDATQVVWECKNYANLKADDFQQVNSYLTPQFGRFGVIVFRGTIQQGYVEHIRRIAAGDPQKIVLLLNERDLLVFLRQAKRGKVSEDHIQAKYDDMVRAL